MIFNPNGRQVTIDGRFCGENRKVGEERRSHIKGPEKVYFTLIGKIQQQKGASKFPPVKLFLPGRGGGEGWCLLSP
jgi:hypothetical protein